MIFPKFGSRALLRTVSSLIFQMGWSKSHLKNCLSR
jgi:hypothetical protein